MLRKVFGRTRTSRTRKSCRPSLFEGQTKILDHLEARRLMAVDVWVDAAGELYIESDGEGDLIDVSADQHGEIWVNINCFTQNLSVILSPESYTLDDLNSIHLIGNGGDDVLSVQNLGEFDGLIVLDGGNGEDVLIGSENDDLLIGGASHDEICGWYGNDVIWGDEVDNAGGGGNDSVNAGPGDDEVHGSRGRDVLFGDTGMDTMYGDEGNDKLNGGDDEDELYGGRNNDNLCGGDGDDLMFGDDGNAVDDVLYGGKDYADGGGGVNYFVDYSLAPNYYIPAVVSPTPGITFTQGLSFFKYRGRVDCPEVPECYIEDYC